MKEIINEYNFEDHNIILKNHLNNNYNANKEKE